MKLIIGGGLAGCWLGYELLQRGHSVVLASRSLPGESSPVAAGLFHPAPGKRWNLREGFAHEYAVAKQAYQSLEKLCGQSLWQEQLLARDLSYLPNAQRWQQLQSAQYVEAAELLKPWIERVDSQAVLFHSSGRVVVPACLSFLRDFLSNHPQGEVWDTLIEDAELEFQAQQILVRGKAFAQVILCRGWREAQGLGAGHLPWRNAAGEILRLVFEQELPPWIHSAAHWRIPLQSAGQSRQALVGATHRWHEFSGQPQPSAVESLRRNLGQDAPQAQLVSAMAGVRPIQQARRVLCEPTPVHPRLWVFNSLGSHGALRAPVYAQRLAERLS